MSDGEETTRGDLARVEQVVASLREERWPLIPVLQRVQEELGYIPPDVVRTIAAGLGLFPSQVQGVVSFYAQLYTSPRGKRVVRVCRGTACHVRGGTTILKLVKRALGVEEGQTTSDWEYTLETVACIGVCALAPNIVIDKTTFGQMNPKKVAQLLGDRRAVK